MMKRMLFILSLISIVSMLRCIEVGGHIARSTTWSPVNNPYIITSFLYVDAGVTLTILPGTQVLCSGADKNDIYNFMWSGNDQPLSKMIIVYGAIKAVGTSANPIKFDKHQTDSIYRWGGIYMAHNAPISTFEFCEFRNTFFCDYIPGDWSLAAVAFENGAINIRNCTFENNLNAIGSGSLQSDVLLYKCKFISTNDSYPPPFGLTGFLGIGAASEPVPEEYYLVTVANCLFTGNAVFATIGDFTNALFLFNSANSFTNVREQEQDNRTESGSVSSYGNTSYSGSKGWGCRSATALDTVYSRRNKLIKPFNANPGNSPLILSSNGYGTNYVSDNYLSGCVQVNTMQSNATTSCIYNNIIENNYADFTLLFENLNPSYQGGQISFFNNLVSFWGDYQYPKIVYTYETSPFIYNNTFRDYRTLFRTIGDSDMVFENNIIPCTQWSSGSISQNHHPLLINNCLAMNVLPPWEMIDGGGNIVENPVFADTLNGDYSLSIDSPCIDTGVNRPDLPAHDIRYHKRITSGTGGEPPTVDMGAYEYNSVYIGGIRGYVYDSVSGLPVDCAKIEILGKLPEFSDTLGCYHYPTGAELYTVKASRWDYQDAIIPIVSVLEGEDTILNIPMQRTNVHSEDHNLPPLNPDFGLTNYPNPFNPTTSISFILPQTGITDLSIYNMKGQKVCTLADKPLGKGHHTIVWNGTDSNGRAVSSGLYFARIEQGNTHRVHKMMLMK